MYSRLYIFSFLFLPLLAAPQVHAQCDPVFKQPLSQRAANYEIHVALDDQTHTVDATQTIRFTNTSPVPVSELRMYMYLNAFKNTGTTFLKGTSQIFGQPFLDRPADEWGWIDVAQITREGGADLSGSMQYIQPDDGNTDDQSVLQVLLDKPVQPGETAVFNLKWRAKMPKTISRAGHSKDFYMFCHWFPQLGVFEQNRAGEWGWNCHQFFRSTEFYADFGVYDVHVTLADKFVMGASGCLVEEKNNGNGTVTRHFHAEDVIDFAWSVYPRFQVREERWKDVQIRLLIAPEHAALAPRYLHALKFALSYLEEHVGKYPYPGITVVDPPFHGLHSGLMEYPTLITVGTFYGMPSHLRMTESLVVHEFVHQYFMGMVASNEKEEAWLDEGFVTYFEDRIIDAEYGEKESLVNVFGYRLDNRELTRLEYTTMANPREGTTARPGWLFSESNFKALIYSKTATTLRTVQELVGEAEMDRIVKAYFEKWKFRHPRGTDFMAVLKEQLLAGRDPAFALQVYGLFEKSIFDAVVLDYAVTRITNDAMPAEQGVYGNNAPSFTYRDGSGAPGFKAKVEVQRKGDWVFPVEILVTFEDGSTQVLNWSGVEGSKIFEFTGSKKVVSAQIDPEQKIGLDIDLNNNSLTLQPATAPCWKYAAKTIFWVQNLMQTTGFLM
ncbi:MAG TPA: M1 family metallopeptidase [Saprospiraceae bacterium]|nr:M1 family metallopeptidase [Saprospiraceae bacterium]